MDLFRPLVQVSLDPNNVTDLFHISVVGFFARATWDPKCRESSNIIAV